MNRNLLIHIALVALLTLACAACDSDGGTTDNTPSTDTTTADDAAMTEDAMAVDDSTTADDTATAEDAGPDEDAVAAVPWGAACTLDEDCAAPTDYCVIQPGFEVGYCTIACPNLGADCTYDDWTCNIIGTCEAPMATWCGPPEEVENGGGVVVACP